MTTEASSRISWCVYVIVTLVWPDLKALALRDIQAPAGRVMGSVHMLHFVFVCVCVCVCV